MEGDIPGTILIEVSLIMIMFQYFINPHSQQAQIESHPQPPPGSNLIDFTREELPPRSDDLIGGFPDAETPIERGTKWENFDDIQSDSLNRNFERFDLF